ncbi:MAG: type IV pili methyl-accepting chemotaxis transducer N-terminal domain-containing protein [Alphaproteobacteria bacterium]|jgi:hypothetical protein|nr:type IV pili methyl-accepting chemotaxis transducer N-terminal domain-containing protein [Alphaproteobacteria bacterium]|tara:strand:- start:33 stop:917 length:885 start_codon:yes stop_codon:yes gene_type:complete
MFANPNARWPLACAAAVLAFASLSGSAGAASAGANHNRVINLAGKQRMLTQKMSKEFLLIALEIDQARNLKSLRATRNLFDRTLKGLRRGDLELGLPPTKKPAILKLLGKVDGLWREFDAAISRTIRSGAISGKRLVAVAWFNLPLLAALDETVGAYQGNAKRQGVDPALAVAINVSGRQRMLTQKMSKEFLLIAYGFEMDKNRKSLKRSAALFETSLDGLLAGDAQLGLPPPPSKKIAAQLERVKRLWLSFVPLLAEVSKGKNVSSRTVQEVASRNLALLRAMNKAVNMYEAL